MKQADFLEKAKTKSDRELQELQTYYLFKTHTDTERIKNNVVFIFWISLIGAIGVAMSVLTAIK